MGYVGVKMKTLLSVCCLFVAVGLTGCPESGPKPDAKYEKKENTSEEFNAPRDQAKGASEAPPT